MSEPIGTWYPIGQRPDETPSIGVDQPGDPARASYLLICERCCDSWIGYLAKDAERQGVEIAAVMAGHNQRRHGIPLRAS